ncbi:MAG TPA: histidine phosphatase family protein [Gemmataceae bacterium]|nr:histidine phosphatase family protein [Gemmataceae bacterium]
MSASRRDSPIVDNAMRNSGGDGLGRAGASGGASTARGDPLRRPQEVYLARHGETPWSLSGQHTGLTDLSLTRRGEQGARQLGARLKGFDFARVFTSPLQRARRTCELAGFVSRAQVDRDLVEWDYGEYEGLRTADVRVRHPDWQMFRDGFPGGESFDQIAERADLVVERVRSIAGGVLLFSSGHFLRVLAVRWLGLGPQSTRYSLLRTTSLSSLTYEHRSQPAIGLRNDTHYISQKHSENSSEC